MPAGVALPFPHTAQGMAPPTVVSLILNTPKVNYPQVCLEARLPGDPKFCQVDKLILTITESPRGYTRRWFVGINTLL